LGFDLQLIGSERYLQGKLDSLSPEQVSRLKESFIKNKHPRFKREFASSRHLPYGKTSDYIASVKDTGLETMANLIKIVGMGSVKSPFGLGFM